MRETGPIFGAGIGYDFGASKAKEGWSGFGLSLRGYFASPGGYATGGGIVQGGLFVW